MIQWRTILVVVIDIRVTSRVIEPWLRERERCRRWLVFERML